MVNETGNARAVREELLDGSEGYALRLLNIIIHIYRFQPSGDNLNGIAEL